MVFKRAPRTPNNIYGTSRTSPCTVHAVFFNICNAPLHSWVGRFQGCPKPQRDMIQLSNRPPGLTPTQCTQRADGVLTSRPLAIQVTILANRWITIVPIQDEKSFPCYDPARCRLRREGRKTRNKISTKNCNEKNNCMSRWP
jgi:hypothetical protein